MFKLNPARAVHLHCGAIDFRKSINGLAAVVEHELGLNAFANAVNAYAGEATGLTANDAFTASLKRMNSRFQKPARKPERSRRAAGKNDGHPSDESASE